MMKIDFKRLRCMKGFNKSGDVLKIPPDVNDFCGDYCPYSRNLSCTYKSNSTTDETCKIDVTKRTITLL